MLDNESVGGPAALLVGTPTGATVDVATGVRRLMAGW
jgi:hypothetical protein